MHKFIYKISSLIFLITLITFSTIKAEIIYTDLDPDETIAPPLYGGISFRIDFNNDIYDDIYFGVDNMPNGCAVSAAGIKRKNQIAGTGDTNTFGNFFPLSFVENEIIGGTESYLWFNNWDEEWNHDVRIPICGSGLNGPGHWAGGLKDRYLGVRFYLNGNYHYGWVAMEIADPPKVCTFKGFAFESEPNKPIKAGQKATSVNDDNYSPINLYPNPASNKVCIVLPEIDLSTASIVISNCLGIELRRINASELSGDKSLTVATDEFAQGLYYCTIIYNGNRITKSFVIVR